MKSRRLLVCYVCLLFVAAGFMFCLRKTSAGQPPPLRDYEEIKAEGVLRMITEYSPTGYYISGDTIEGFQYELSRAIAAVSGLEVHTQLEMSLTESFKALDDNTCDVLAQNLPVTSELKEEYLFTEPIVMSKQVLAQRTAAANEGIQPIRNHLDLAKKTIHVPKDSPALQRIIHLESEMGDSVYVVEDEKYSSEQLLIMVAKGEIDYAVCDRQIALRLRPELPEIDMDTDMSFTQLQAWAVRKTSPALADSLNRWLREIRQNGSFEKIYGRYYGATH
jgi:membrane-bound lytic murein transglycosylase MltF